MADGASAGSDWNRYWPVGVVLIAGLGISAVLGWLLDRDAIRHDEARFDAECLQIASTLQQGMERYEERLARLADYCGRFDKMPREAWLFRAYAMTDLGGNLTGVAHAAYCLKTKATNSAGRLEDAGRNSGGAEGRPSNASQLRVEQCYARPGFIPIAAGTDMAEETDWHPSLAPALTTARGWISPRPIQVARTNGSRETGFWFALTFFPADYAAEPLHETGVSPAQRAKRLAAFRRNTAAGVLAAFISTDFIVDRNNDPARRSRLDARLYASREPARETLFNPRFPRPKHPAHQRRIPMRWYGRNWCLDLMSTPYFDADSLRYRSWMAAGAGTAITLLAAGLMALSLGFRVRQERMTTEIVEARDALAAAEKERERLGHDLHDGAIQSLYAIQLGLARTAQNVAATVPAAAEVLTGTRERVDEVIAELRQFIVNREAERSGIARVGLDNVLAAMVARLQPTTSAELEFYAQPGAADRLSLAQAIQLTQLAKTAVANSLRHARPRHVRIRLRASGEKVCLEIADDGTGFDVEAVRQEVRSGNAGEGSGLGLETMERRASEIGGVLSIDSRRGAGTRVLVTVPASHSGSGENQQSEEREIA